MTLSAVATLLVEDFLPECRKTYLFNNYKQSSVYRTYRDIVPARSSSKHHPTLMKFKEEDIEDVDTTNGEFKVFSNSTRERIINFGHKSANSMPSSSCPDWEKFHLPYKHFFAISRLRSTWTRYMLPKSYLESAYLSLDNKALTDYYQEPLPATENDHITTTDDFTESFQDEIPRKKVTTIIHYVSTIIRYC